MTHLDLFSGIGGFALAAKWAGIETVAFCEIDSFCRQVLKKHWPETQIYTDVRDINQHDHVDIMTAGFPCQPFSVAGKKKGKDDDRYLWPEVIRLIRVSNPTWFIGENVPGIISHLDHILEDLEREGYSWRAYLIPASAVYAPHKRERVWIIANSNSERCNNGGDNRKERYIQENIHRYFAQVQSEWAQFIPQSWKDFNAETWLTYPNSFTSIKTDSTSQSFQSKWNSRMGFARQDREHFDGLGWKKNQPPISGVDDGLSSIVDRNRALGNAIVPQVVFPIMKMIKDLNSN